MNHEEEFDALARGKMEERSFPFQEAHWLDAKRLIDAQRGRTRGGLLYWLAGAALLIFVTGVWWAMDADRSVGTEPVAQQKISIQKGTEEKVAAKIDVPVKDERAAFVNEERSVPVAMQEVQAPMNTTTQDPDPLSAKAQMDAEGSKPRTTAATPMATTEVEAGTHGTVPVSDPNTAPSAEEVSPVTKPEDELEPEVVDLEPTSAPDGASTEQPKALVEGAIAVSAVTSDASKVDEHGPEVVPPNATTVVEVATPVEPEYSTDLTEATGSAAITSDANTDVPPQDTLNSAPMEPAAPPLVPDAAPWEISLIGGMLRSTSRYSGGNSEDWNGSVDPLWTAGGGLEIMHMGRNFGIGTGLFLGSYSERINTDELTSSTLDIQRTWSFVPIDTTILFITDTVVQGSETIYVGEGVPMTINVLTSTNDTLVTETVQREAQVVENTVSYLEIPLLLDGHLVQGRWSLGVRGGPSLALLTKRRGSIPNASNDGYTPFTEQQFRELTLGYMLRGYVRYRFNAAWSVGLEPMLRGQLMNSLGEGDLSKMSSAGGAMISLSYRLR